MFDSSEVQIPILSMSDNLLKIELTINYKCLLTVSYSVRTGIKHSLGASVFTGYAGREKAPREALTAALSRGTGRPVAGAPVRAACSVERPRAPGSGVRGASGDLARTLHPVHVAVLSEAVRRREEAAQCLGSRNNKAPSLHLLFPSKENAAWKRSRRRRTWRWGGGRGGGPGEPGASRWVRVAFGNRTLGMAVRLPMC